MKTSFSVRFRQQGRTLIELIIAMTIGLVIVIGVSSLYISSSGISRTANQVSTTEQAGQLAMLLIGESIKLSAYGEILGSDYAAQGQTLMDGTHLRGCTGSRFTDAFPAYVAPPAPQTPPDLGCTLAAAGDALYVRFQSRPVVAEMRAAEATRNNITDCAGSTANQSQILESGNLRAGRGWTRNLVTNVFFLDPLTRELRCEGYGGGGAQPLVRDVAEFRVFYRFDDAAFAAGANGVTHAAPFGGSIRDAGEINTFAVGSVIDPWNYVVAVLVCMTITTDEQGTSVTTTNNRASRCPLDPGEAETGLDLFTSTTDGRIRRTFSQVFTVRAKATPSPSLL